VREWMVARQQEMGRDGGVIMEGRDIGTKVFPHAEVKIFLEADPEVRAARRLLQQESGLSPEQARALASELHQRDVRDRTRAASPLVAAPDALLLDSSNLTIDQVVQRVLEVVAQKLRAAASEQS
jgi:cytidylate kinase